MRTRRWIVPWLAVLALTSCGSDDCDLFADPTCLSSEAMAADVAWLAAPEREGRRPGTEGNLQTVSRVVDRFREAGLEAPADGFRQGFAYSAWSLDAAPGLTLAGAPQSLGRDFEALDFSASGSASGEVVFVGYGRTVPPFDPGDWPDCPLPTAGHDDWTGVDATGLVVLALRGLPDGEQAQDCPPDPLCVTAGIRCFGSLYQGLKAEAQGAAGLLQVYPFDRPDAASPFRSAGQGAPLPALLLYQAVAEAALPEIRQWSEAAGTAAATPRTTGVTARLAVEGTTFLQTADNVLGVLPGVDPALRDEVVVVGAHLDHLGSPAFQDTLYPGADDNASGLAVILELARAAAASPTQPARSILFAAWNAEEVGLLGSCFYARYEPLVPLQRTVAAFSVDMVGAGRPDLLLYGGADHPWIVSLARDAAMGFGLTGTIEPREQLLASDHACFATAGVPGLLALTPPFEDHLHYHQPSDTYENLDLDTLSASAALVWSAVQPLAMGANPP